MLEFFIALLGGLYYASKISSDRRGVKSAMQQGKSATNYLSERTEELRLRAVDRDLVADILCENIQWRVMDDDFADLGVDTSVLPMKELRHLYSDLLLARHGKIRHDYLTSHHNILGLDWYECEAFGTAGRARRDAWLGCLAAIEEELIRHGVDPFFIFIPTTCYEVGCMRDHVSPVRLRDIGDRRYALGQVWLLASSYYNSDLRIVFS